MSACAFILGSCGMRLDNQPNIKNTQPSTQVNTNTTKELFFIDKKDTNQTKNNTQELLLCHLLMINQNTNQ